MNQRIVVRLPRGVKRRLKRAIRKTRDAGLRTRIQIVLLYETGWGAYRIAATLGCVPATAVRVVRRFQSLGEEGLLDGRRENGQLKVDDDVRQALAELVDGSPEDHGWSRTNWTRELLAKTLHRQIQVEVSVTTVARMLQDLRARWGMARPIVVCPWSKARKARRLRAIRKIVDRLPTNEVAYFEDEVDIHLNPRIGRDWMLPGRQKLILTPGQNRKRYLAGARAVQGNDLVFVSSDRKNSELFLALLEKLRKRHPRARRIHLILDNYGIHSSRKVRQYLREQGLLFHLHFLPPYCPEHNDIERLWRKVHANVTRNHRCKTIEELMRRVIWYLHREATRLSKSKSIRSKGISNVRRAA
jgi:transposase